MHKKRVSTPRIFVCHEKKKKHKDASSMFRGRQIKVEKADDV
jgi:hypothetical protein